MSAKPETRAFSNGSFFETTTWGARLALSLLLVLLAAGLSFADGNKHKLSKDLEALKGGNSGATVDVKLSKAAIAAPRLTSSSNSTKRRPMPIIRRCRARAAF